MNDGDEKKDLEGGEKDDITYADLDDNALSSGIKHIVTNQSIPIICNKTYSEYYCYDQTFVCYYFCRKSEK